jgi:23S rRNA (cytosine1962-C5)-methyltransferase
MTKAKRPRPDRIEKAPEAAMRTAPSHRSGDKERPEKRASGNRAAANQGAKHETSRDSRRIPRSADKVTGHPDKRATGPSAGSSGHGPGARVSRRAADRLRAGHVWVYASDVESLNAGDGDAPAGDAPALLPVADSRGLLLGTALYSPTSQIALRMVSREAIGHTKWLDLLDERLRGAIARRKPMLTDETDACRLCFSEADELPGLVIDKYGGLIILQLLTKGLDSGAVRDVCIRALREELDPVSIVERPDPRVRELEGLSAPSAEPLYVRGPDSALTSGGTKRARNHNPSVATPRSQFRLNGLAFQFDADSGQKTGAFLDQRANYQAARAWAERLGATGRALDVCCYQGGFALHLAEVCDTVTGIDASRASLEVAEQNLVANRERLKAEVDWVAGDAFEILRDWSNGGEKYDAVVLDPPAFAKTQRAVEGALRGYKELNLRALKMARPGGLLITCSCSHHVGWKDLVGAVAAAAADAHRRVRLLERRGAALDHPVVLNLPETEYLKCLVLEVE